MENLEEVAIVGGGPAGAHCAFELAKQNIRPTIFDHSHPREKPCGGGISPALLKKFPFFEKFRSEGFTFGDLKIISCVDAQVVTRSFENGFCISRQYLDQQLMDMATKTGAKLIKEKVIDVTLKKDIWKIKTKNKVFSAKILVGADGVNSCVRREIIGPIAKENLALTFGYLSVSPEKESPVIKFLAEIPGYIWVFQGKKYVNIGIGGELNHGSILKPLLDNFIKLNYKRTRIVSQYAAMLPSARDPEFFKVPCAGENWILIGDAAGHVDPISGGGILYAIWGSKLAAEAILQNDVQSFDAKWRNDYGGILEERCRNKDAYYDPLRSTAAMIMGLVNGTYFRPQT